MLSEGREERPNIFRRLSYKSTAFSKRVFTEFELVISFQLAVLFLLLKVIQ